VNFLAKKKNFKRSGQGKRARTSYEFKIQQSLYFDTPKNRANPKAAKNCRFFGKTPQVAPRSAES
jgi:hypothetical protein